MKEDNNETSNVINVKEARKFFEQPTTVSNKILAPRQFSKKSETLEAQENPPVSPPVISASKDIARYDNTKPTDTSNLTKKLYHPGSSNGHQFQKPLPHNDLNNHSNPPDRLINVKSVNGRDSNRVKQVTTENANKTDDDSSITHIGLLDEIVHFSNFNVLKKSGQSGKVILDRDVLDADLQTVKRPGNLYSSDDSTNEEKVKERAFMKEWKPDGLLLELYKLGFADEALASDANHLSYINHQGYLEKLPFSKNKDTFLKTWKRKFFKLQDGFLHCYENSTCLVEEEKYELSGGKFEENGDKMFGIEDGRGHHIIVRCANASDYQDWIRSIKSQMQNVTKSKWIQPSVSFSPHPQKKVCLIEIGSCSIRAGLLELNPTLPSIFCPCVFSIDNSTGEKYFSSDALSPDIRQRSSLFFPLRATNRVDKYTIDWNAFPFLFDSIFKRLNIDQRKYSIFLSLPTNFTPKVKQKFAEVLFDDLKIGALCISSQSLLSLYYYRSLSGIVVTMGDSIEIMPVYDGYVVEGGIMRLPLGGQKIVENLSRSFENMESFLSSSSYVDQQIVRYAAEKMCYVAMDVKSESKKSDLCKSIDLSRFQLPSQMPRSLTSAEGRYVSPEGFFNMDLWGIDNFPLQKMIFKAITACPIDSRRQMWRSIFLCGGVSLLPGLKERLLKELSDLAPPSITVEVHAADNRYHSSYIGATVQALMPAFEHQCVTRQEWNELGTGCLTKLSTY